MRTTWHGIRTIAFRNPRNSIRSSSSRCSDRREVNANDTDTVDFLRGALRAMKKAQPAVYESVMEAVESRDESCAAVLLKKTSPMVVDGSNVACAFRSASDKPRLNNILLLRRELRRKGHFPIYIYADANLRHRVDQPGTIEQLIESQEILPVDSGTDADATIVLEAVRRGCPIVTNDRMADWDPEEKIEKIRFWIEGDEVGFRVS